MKKIILFFIFILLISNILSCSNNQININNASKQELDKIIWVGPATAENIINKRPFKSIDKLIKVTYIGEKKLADIKKENLACVDFKENKTKFKENKTKNTNKNTQNKENQTNEKVNQNSIENKNLNDSLNKNSNNKFSKKQSIIFKEINLNQETKDIKTNNHKNKTEQNSIMGINLNKNYSIYGFIGFCFLLGFLFTIKILQNKKYNKNEFIENE